MFEVFEVRYFGVRSKTTLYVYVYVDIDQDIYQREL